MKNVLQKVKPQASIELWRHDLLPQAFEQREIFLIECRIAGSYYAKADEIITADTELPCYVKLRREQNNNHDKLAILVLTEQGEKLGYIPRQKNEIIARLMDVGKAFTAQLTERKVESNWTNLKIKIYLKE